MPPNTLVMHSCPCSQSGRVISSRSTPLNLFVEFSYDSLGAINQMSDPGGSNFNSQFG